MEHVKSREETKDSKAEEQDGLQQSGELQQVHVHERSWEPPHYDKLQCTIYSYQGIYVCFTWNALNIYQTNLPNSESKIR